MGTPRDRLLGGYDDLDDLRVALRPWPLAQWTVVAERGLWFSGKGFSTPSPHSVVCKALFSLHHRKDSDVLCVRASLWGEKHYLVTSLGPLCFLLGVSAGLQTEWRKTKHFISCLEKPSRCLIPGASIVSTSPQPVFMGKTKTWGRSLTKLKLQSRDFSRQTFPWRGQNNEYFRSAGRVVSVTTA